MNKRITGRLAVLALLLATGGCEFLKNHVKVESNDRSPGADQHFNSPAAEARRDRIAVSVNLWSSDSNR